MPISYAERDIALYQATQNGVRLYTKIGGYGGSSTRTELAAGIIALCAHGPVHIGSDSEAFVNTANDILHKIHHNTKPHRSWKLISDGDLWEHFYRAAIQKGPRSIKLTWVKGHATQEHIDKSITTLVNKAGNDEADITADIGTALHGQEIINLAQQFHNRHNDYQRLMCDISHHIIEGYLIHRRMTELSETTQKEKDKHTDNKVGYKPLPYPNLANTRKLHTTSTMNEFNHFTKTNTNATQIEHFLANALFASCGSSDRPITWIELYILYRSRGYTKPIQDHKNRAVTRATADKQIRAFKNACRGVVSRILQDSEDRKLFKPTTTTPNSLIGVGLLGKHAAIGCSLHVTKEEQANIASSLVKLGRVLSNKHTYDFIQNSRTIAPTELRLNGRVGWDSTIPILTHDFSKDTGRCTSASDSEHPRTPVTSFFECPNCQAVEPSSCKHFQYRDLDIKHKCSNCAKYNAVRFWKCPCGSRWQHCQVHWYSVTPETYSHMSTASGQSHSKAGTPWRKRKRANYAGGLSYDELLAEEKRETHHRLRKLTRPNAETVITLGKQVHTSIYCISPNLVGPSLKKRFMGGS